MDGNVEGADEDCKNVEALDSSIQPGNGAAVGGLLKSSGDSSRLAASSTVELGHGQLVIRVGSIGCSAVNYKCSNEPM